MYPWWGKQLRTKRKRPFLMSCLMGFIVSSFEISIFAFVQRGTSTIMLRMPLFWSAKRGMSWKGETTLPLCSMKTRWSDQSKYIEIVSTVYEGKGLKLAEGIVYAPRVLGAPTTRVLYSAGKER